MPNNEKIKLEETLTEFFKVLQDLVIQFSSVQEKKYYLINPELESPGSKYVKAEFAGNQIIDIFFAGRFEGSVFRTKFSMDEIEFIKNKYPKTFSICEMLAVGDIKEEDEEDEEDDYIP